MAVTSERKRILIWGKTSPEVSSKYVETVCTAGVLEDGRPVRLYPIPYRYLDKGFARYQWIEATITKSDGDPRPESYKIDKGSIKLREKLPSTKDEWGVRREWIFKNTCWHFASVEELKEAQAVDRTSLGLVEPNEIIGIKITERSADEAKSFEEKVARLRKDLKAKSDQLNLFEQTVPSEMKKLEFQKHRISVNWLCKGPACTGHDMQILDWEISELMRKAGPEKALEKVKAICDLASFDTWFYLGNLFLHPTSFLIVGLWYPRRANLLFR